MSIADLQIKARRLGEIRLGDTVTKNGKTYPVSLDTFRLTSIAKGLLDVAARKWGGRVEPWQPGNTVKWQLVTEVSELPVYVAPQDPDDVTWYELWSAAGLQRRCDGVNIVGRDQTLPCVCNPERRECDMVTRLQVMLPDLPDVGVWVLTSTGYYAATEMAGSIQIVMRTARETGLLPEAVLAIEHREKKVPGQPTKQFVVPVLRFADTLSTFLPSDAAPTRLSASTPAPLPGGEREGGAVEFPHAPAPPDPQPVVEVEDEVEGELVPDEAEWAALLELLNETADDGTMSEVEARVRRLFRLMDSVGLWGNHDTARHASLKKMYDTIHLSDLRKAELNQFAEASFAAAKAKVSDGD